MCAFGNSLGDKSFDALELQFGNHGAHRGLVGTRITHDHALGDALGNGFHRRHFGRRHQHPCRRVAGLAGILEYVEHALLHRALKIGVIQQYIRRLAAEFLVHSLDRRGGIARDLRAGPSRSGKRHHVDIAVRRQRRPDVLAIAID